MSSRPSISGYTGIPLGSVAGIKLELDITFLLILPLFAWMIGRNFSIYLDILGLDRYIPYYDTHSVLRFFLGLITAILLFVAVLAHELTHSLVGRIYKHKTNKITLWLLGGVAEMDFNEVDSDVESRRDPTPTSNSMDNTQYVNERMHKSPVSESIIAFVGPVTSFIIAFVCLGIFMLIEYYILTFLVISNGKQAFFVSLAACIGAMYVLNLTLAIFNLVPALPMDGGRVLRGILAGTSLGYVKATYISVMISRTIAILMAVIGILTFNLWWLLLTLFLYKASSMELERVSLERIFGPIKVRMIQSNPIIVEEETSCYQALRIARARNINAMPVVCTREISDETAPSLAGNEHKRVIGYITLAQLATIPHSNLDNVKVGDICTHKVVTLNQNSSSFTVFEKMAAYGVDTVITVDSESHLVGIVVLSDLARAEPVSNLLRRLQNESESNPRNIRVREDTPSVGSIEV